jgi:hypothetical protein
MTELEVEANDVRPLILELDRFPGPRPPEGMALAIDGEIFQDAYLAPLNANREVDLIPKIGGR